MFLYMPDAEELKSHLLDLIDNLKDSGLDDQEAFWVASKRIGTISDWGEEYRQENNTILQIRRSAVILSGVLIYFFFHHLIEIISKSFYIILLNYDIDGNLALNWVSRYLITIYFFFIVILTTIYLAEKKVIDLIEQVKVKPTYIIITLLLTIVFGVVNTCLNPIAKNLMYENYPLIGRYLEIYNYFGYIFPTIICVGFVLIYAKYHKKANI